MVYLGVLLNLQNHHLLLIVLMIHLHQRMMQIHNLYKLKRVFQFHLHQLPLQMFHLQINHL